VPWIAVVALTSMATATVWASHGGPAPTEQAVAHPALPQRCAQRAVALPEVRAQRDVSRASFPSPRRTRAVCGARHAGAR
jgi:hypothetical protein